MHSHQHKLAKARQHLQSYDSKVKEWYGLHSGRPFSAFKHQEEVICQGTRHVFSYDPVENFPSIECGLILGDFLHNLRSALDHLIYELATKYTSSLSDKAAGQCEFPIFWERPMDTGEENRRIGCIDPHAANLIKGIQPQLLGSDYSQHPLWILNELERINKHRTLHLVAQYMVQNDLAGRNMAIVRFEGLVQGERLEKGAKVAEFVVTGIDPNQPMDVDYRPSTLMTFEPGLPLSGKPLFVHFNVILDEIMRIAITPLETFL